MNNFSNFQFQSLFFVILLCMQIYIPFYCSEEQTDTKQNKVTKIITSFLSSNKYTIGITFISLLGFLTIYFIHKQLNKKNNLYTTSSNINDDIDQPEDKRQLLAAINVANIRCEKYRNAFKDFVNLYYGPLEDILRELEIEKAYYKKFEKYKGQIDPYHGNKEYQDLYHNPPLIPCFFEAFNYEMQSFFYNIDVLLPLIKMILSNELFLDKYFGIYLRDPIFALARDKNLLYRSKILETINIAVEYTNNWSTLDLVDSGSGFRMSYFHMLLLFIKTAHATYGDTIYNQLWYDELERLQNNMINFYLNTRSFVLTTPDISSRIQLFFENKYEIPDAITDVTWEDVIIEHLEDLYCEIPEETATCYITQWFNDLTFYPQKFDIAANDCTIKKLFNKFILDPLYHIGKEDLDYFTQNCKPPLQLEHHTINDLPLIYYIVQKQDFALAQEYIPSEELIKTKYDFNKNILHILAQHSDEHEGVFQIIKAIKIKVTPEAWKILINEKTKYQNGTDQPKKPFEFAKNHDVKIFLTQIEKNKIAKPICSVAKFCDDKNTIFDIEENKNHILEEKYLIQTTFPV